MPDFATRRADITAKQEVVAKLLADLGCEAAILLVPAHLAWFCSGLNLRGLYTDSERPGVYTNGKMRWLICCNVDTQRLFDEELDGQGFMLKEWGWATGRAQLLAELVQGKKICSDRPFPNMPLLADKLRLLTRPLYPSDAIRLGRLGEALAHALEATARGLRQGETEAEVAGQLAHRLYHRGLDVHSLSVTADQRGVQLRRSGYTDAPIETFATLQATAMQGGLHATASRMVSFGTPTGELRDAVDAACKVSATFRSLSKPGETMTEVVETSLRVVKGTPMEFEWRLSAPGYGTGWYPADDLRRVGQDDPFADQQPLVWQPRFGAAAVVDTVIVSSTGGLNVTRPDEWPFKKITIAGNTYTIPDVLVRSE
jgi:Xaa-Pro dipeptidase